ncbi:MAG: hypothetical protein H6742_12090 [Alphaproteobacteria bacterium]|nr:hypothetical protein [Alphaproteobacteria bacterium]
MLLWWGLACGLSGGPGADCADLDCRRAAVAKAWPEDPAAVRAEVQAEGDALVRASLVEAVFEAHPGAGLCTELPAGIVRRRCERVDADAARWTLDELDPTAQAAAIGPAFRSLAAGPTARLPGLSTATPARDCGNEVPEHSCLVERAREAARTGDLHGAAAACQAVGDVRWQPACMVEAAELGCRTQTVEHCGIAAELCLGAGAWQVPCLEHVAETVATLADPATQAPSTAAATGASARGWAALRQRTTELELRLGPLDLLRAHRLVDRVWAESARLSYGRASVLVGDPLDQLPADARPHVRAAVAWRIVDAEPPASLSDGAAAVVEALGQRGARGRDRLLERNHPSPVDLWTDDLPGEDELPWVAYLGPARRAVSSDPEIDARVVVLEAAARTSPPADWMLVEGLHDPARIVRWTAARLLAAIEPGHPALATARADPDALVARRAAAP